MWRHVFHSSYTDAVDVEAPDQLQEVSLFITPW
jgi:hypothetical protein